MKKTLLSLTAFLSAFSVFFGAVSALDITDVFSNEVPLVDDAYTQVLNDYDSSWGYFDNEVIECNSTDGSLTITSPTIEDSGFDPATTYRLFLSPYRIGDIKNWDTSVDVSNIIMKEQTIETGAQNVTFNIGWWELNSNIAYYWFLLPIDIYDWIWTPSNEICFQLNQNICMLDTACDTLDWILNPVKEQEPESMEEGHGAAGECASMDLMHPGYTSDGKNITLTWTAIPGSDTLDIILLNPEEEVFETIATVKMSDEKYVYKMRWNGVHEFRFRSDCWEAKLKPKIEEGIATSEPEKIVTPATGPAENILYIAIAAIVLYGAYTIFFRKSDNN